MRFSTVSARFGHQLATFVFSRLVFAGNLTNSVLFSTRLPVSVVFGLVCSCLGVPGWDFLPYLRSLVISRNVFFFQSSFLQETSKTAYFLYRLLVSVDIGLVCSWVGVAGWDFPPYLRGLVINLQLLFYQGSSLQEISQTVYFFPLDCQFPSFLVSSAPELGSRDEIFHHICAVWPSVCNVLFRQCMFTQQISEKAYSLSRLLVSVDISLVCSWVGVAGWDFPPYLRGLVINLQCFVSTMPVYAADIRNSIFFKARLCRRYQKQLFFRLDC